MTGAPPTSDLKARAREDIDQGRVELLDELQRIPISELHHSDPNLFARLTPDQRAKLFSQAAVQNRGPRRATPPGRPRRGRPSSVRCLWNRLPLVARSQFAGLFFTAIMSGLSVAGFSREQAIFDLASRPASLSADTAYWPSCMRLTPSTDGCLYTITASLPWRGAAQALSLGPTQLRKTNSHLDNRKTLTRGDTLVVWRERIPLEN